MEGAVAMFKTYINETETSLAERSIEKRPAGPLPPSPVGPAAPGIAAPQPSRYPYGDPGTNEFMYLDWKPFNLPNMRNARKIHQAFEDWKRLLLAARSSATANGEIFKRWFGKNDNQKVLHIIKKLLQDTNNGLPDAQPLVTKAVNEEKDFGTGKGGIPACRTPNMRAYMRSATGHFHYCDYGLQLPSLNDIDCASLGTKVSQNMKSIAGTMVHEFTHWNETHIPILGEKIDDYTRGAWNSFNLPDEEKLLNADNYAWLANNAFFTARCPQKFEEPARTKPNEADEDASTKDLRW